MRSAPALLAAALGVAMLLVVPAPVRATHGARHYPDLKTLRPADLRFDW